MVAVVNANSAAALRAAWDNVLGPHIYVFYGAFLASFIFTPLMRSVATYYRVIDVPDRVRKIHATPVAYLGGVAVFLGWMVGLAVSRFYIPAAEIGTENLKVKFSIVIGAAASIVIGLWDDIRRVKPGVKILGQVAAALFMLSQGVGSHCLEPVLSPLSARLAANFGRDFAIPAALITAFSWLAAVLMVVVCCNAANLLDGLDGLCGGVTAIIAAGFLFLAIHLASRGINHDWDPVRIVLALALLGALLGFLPYNFNPAWIFLGDAGSMFLGYCCATLILLMAEVEPRWFLAAIIMFALPILDTILALARRWVNRRPLFSADRYHFHHQLIARGYTVRKTVLIAYAITFGFCVMGALIVFLRVRYAVAFYMVIFGMLIVAALKLGMVHETAPRIVSPQPVGAQGAATSLAAEPSDVLDLQAVQSPGSEITNSASKSYKPT